MAVRRKGGVFTQSGYGTAPQPAMDINKQQAQPTQQIARRAQAQQTPSPTLPQAPPQTPPGAGAPMSPTNVDPFLIPGGPIEDQVDPLTILSLLQQRGRL